MQKDSREREGKTVDWGCHHSRCGLNDRGRMRPRQAKDGRMLRNRLTAGERSRRKSTNKHPQAPTEHPDCPHQGQTSSWEGHGKGGKKGRGIYCDIRKKYGS